MAATRSDERQRQCCLDHVRIWSSGPSTKSGGLVKNRHGGAPEGAPARHTAGGTLKRCQTKMLRLTGAPLPHVRGGRKMKAAPRALLLPGPMNHVSTFADVMRLKSAGCLTCES